MNEIDARQDESMPVAQFNHRSNQLGGHEALHDKVVEALKEIYDPEIPVNIYDLGLVYTIDIDEEARVSIEMTLTAPGCPVAQTFPGTVENEVNRVEGVTETTVELVWDPPWTQERMTESARLDLGFF
jgi:FeS assembly SUF system protein